MAQDIFNRPTFASLGTNLSDTTGAYGRYSSVVDQFFIEHGRFRELSFRLRFDW